MPIFEGATTSDRAGTEIPDGFLVSTDRRLAEINNQLQRVASRLYEAGFPAGPSQVSNNKPSEDNPRSRMTQRVDELYDVAQAITAQVERLI